MGMQTGRERILKVTLLLLLVFCGGVRTTPLEVEVKTSASVTRLIDDCTSSQVSISGLVRRSEGGLVATVNNGVLDVVPGAASGSKRLVFPLSNVGTCFNFGAYTHIDFRILAPVGAPAVTVKTLVGTGGCAASVDSTPGSSNNYLTFNG